MAPFPFARQSELSHSPSNDVWVDALRQLCATLPNDLNAAVFVVVHVAATSPGLLPQILDQAGALPTRHAVDGERIKLGQVYVAPPDRHMLVVDGHIQLTSGPK